MDTGSVLAWAVLALASLVMAFVAAAEVSLVTISRANVRQLIEDGAPRAQALQTLLEDPPHFVIALMALKGAAYVSAASSAAWLALEASGGSLMRLALALVATWGMVLCIQIVARAAAMRSLQSSALRLGRPVRFLATLLAPLTAALRTLGDLVLGAANKASTRDLFLSEDGLRFLINVSDEPGLIEEDEKEMIASIFELSETVAREVMVPRIDIVAVEQNASLREALDAIIQAGHSRIPVYRDNVDNIQGVLYAKDLLPPFRDGRHDVPVTELMRAAYFVPESKKVDDLLKELQQRKVHMAIVVDEYGGTAGVVTIEDLLEEIVGEIQDEYDSELPMVVKVNDDEFLVDARISIYEVSKLLGVELPAEESDTLGGFIFSQLGRVPTVGSQVHYDHLTLDVISVTGRRIQQVRVTWTSTEKEAEAPEVHAKKALSTLSSFF